MYEYLSPQERLEMISRILLKGIFYFQDKQRFENERLTESNQSRGVFNETKDDVHINGNVRKISN